MNLTTRQSRSCNFLRNLAKIRLIAQKCNHKILLIDFNAFVTSDIRLALKNSLTLLLEIKTSKNTILWKTKNHRYSVLGIDFIRLCYLFTLSWLYYFIYLRLNTNDFFTSEILHLTNNEYTWLDYIDCNFSRYRTLRCLANEGEEECWILPNGR